MSAKRFPPNAEAQDNEDKPVKEGVSRWGFWIVNLLSVAMLGIATTLMWKTAEILRDHEKKITLNTEWQEKRSSYPEDPNDLQLRFQKAIAQEQAIAYDRLYNKIDSLANTVSALTLDFRDFKGRRSESASETRN